VLANLLNIEATLQRIEKLMETQIKVKAEKKSPKVIETPEQFMDRLKVEFQDIHDFDVVLAKCREYYRIKRQICRRDTIENWFIRERDWRQKNGVPDEPAKKAGLVL
jgi:hypothetical protein